MPADSIQKGKISMFEEDVDINENPIKARVAPDLASDSVTPPLVIPWYLRGDMGELEAESEVIFVMFSDLTGMIMARADGEWSGTLYGSTAVLGELKVDAEPTFLGEVTFEKDIELGEGLTASGSINAHDLKTDQVRSYNDHIHGGVEPGTEQTEGPQ